MKLHKEDRFIATVQLLKDAERAKFQLPAAKAREVCNNIYLKDHKIEKMAVRGIRFEGNQTKMVEENKNKYLKTFHKKTLYFT